MKKIVISLEALNSGLGGRKVFMAVFVVGG